MSGDPLIIYAVTKEIIMNIPTNEACGYVKVNDK
jgi:hypothetical protein